MAKKGDAKKSTDALIVDTERSLIDIYARKMAAIRLFDYYDTWIKNDSTSDADSLDVTISLIHGGNSTWTWETYAMNSPNFLNHFYPNGTEQKELIINGRRRDTSVSPWILQTFTYNKRTTKSIDTDNYFKDSMSTMWCKDRLIYLEQMHQSLLSQQRELEDQLKSLGVAEEDIISLEDNGSVPGNYDQLKLVYNVGMVKEMYFSPKKGFQQLANLIKGQNQPSKVKDAIELWDASKSNKGMVWLYYPKNSTDTWAWEPPSASPIERNVYAFQFHYNPSTISMAYNGSPDLDITLFTSGQDKFNYLGDKTMSTISFQIVLNRIADFQYYEPTKNGGQLISGVGDIYASKNPSKADQKRIYKYGTMYDVEFLLGAIMGFKFKTRLRGNTTDIGFLVGRPVDLHLGEGLRYWGYISGMAVEHKIFDERMVPTFSVLEITFNRIPDYIEVDEAASGSGASRQVGTYDSTTTDTLANDSSGGGGTVRYE